MDFFFLEYKGNGSDTNRSIITKREAWCMWRWGAPWGGGGKKRFRILTLRLSASVLGHKAIGLRSESVLFWGRGNRFPVLGNQKASKKKPKSVIREPFPKIQSLSVGTWSDRFEFGNEGKSPIFILRWFVSFGVPERQPGTDQSPATPLLSAQLFTQSTWFGGFSLARFTEEPLKM